MDTYLKKFKALVEYLEQNDNIHELRLQTSFDDDEETVEGIEYIFDDLNNNVGYNLPEVYKDYMLFNATRLHCFFEFEQDQHWARFEFNLEHIGMRLVYPDNTDGLEFKEQSEEDYALWKTFKYFDTRPDTGDNKMAVFSFKEGISPPNEPEIYFLDRSLCNKMNLNYGGYLDALLDLVGFGNWQYLFTDADFNSGTYDHLPKSIKKGLDTVSRLFPHKDYSKYYAMLEQKTQ